MYPTTQSAPATPVPPLVSFDPKQGVIDSSNPNHNITYEVFIKGDLLPHDAQRYGKRSINAEKILAHWRDWFVPSNNSPTDSQESMDKFIDALIAMEVLLPEQRENTVEQLYSNDEILQWFKQPINFIFFLRYIPLDDISEVCLPLHCALSINTIRETGSALAMLQDNMGVDLKLEQLVPNTKMTPLHYTIVEGCKRSSFQDDSTESAQQLFDIAVQLLSRTDVLCNPEHQFLLLDACRASKEVNTNFVITHLIERGFDVNMYPTGFYPLDLAAAQGAKDRVECLMRASGTTELKFCFQTIQALVKKSQELFTESKIQEANTYQEVAVLLLNQISFSDRKLYPQFFKDDGSIKVVIEEEPSTSKAVTYLEKENKQNSTYTDPIKQVVTEPKPDPVKSNREKPIHNSADKTDNQQSHKDSNPINLMQRILRLLEAMMFPFRWIAHLVQKIRLLFTPSSPSSNTNHLAV